MVSWMSKSREVGCPYSLWYQLRNKPCRCDGRQRQSPQCSSRYTLDDDDEERSRMEYLYYSMVHSCHKRIHCLTNVHQSLRQYLWSRGRAPFFPSLLVNNRRHCRCLRPKGRRSERDRESNSKCVSNFANAGRPRAPGQRAVKGDHHANPLVGSGHG